MAASIGQHGFWGFSAGFNCSDCVPALRSHGYDTGKALKAIEGDGNTVSEEEGVEELNVLLIHPGDIRHILQTVSQRLREKPDLTTDGSSSSSESGHRSRKRRRAVNFYLLEAPLEALARDLLLLQVFCDYALPIRQRGNVFLEIFGNCKVQPRTERYIDRLSHELRALLAAAAPGSTSTSTRKTGGDLGAALALRDVLDFSLLKFRERDELEGVLKSYSPLVPFDVETLRDHRLRGYLGDRYDSRKAVADWDYHACLKHSASIVHIKQFKDWRLTGIAFEFGDQQYTAPNRTMMSYVEGFMKKGKEKGIKKEVRGFWTDIVSSPYFSFGIDCETTRNKFAEGLFEIQNKNTGTEQHRHHAVEIALYNLFSYIWELESGEPYQMTKANDIFSGLGKQAEANGEEPDEEEKKEEKNLAEKLQQTELEPILETVDVDEEAEGRKEEQEQQQQQQRKEGEEEMKEPEEASKNIEGSPEVNEVNVESADCAEGPNKEIRSEAQTDTSMAMKTTDVHTPSLSGLDASIAELAEDIRKAENIVESWQDVKIYPMTGDVLGALSRKKFENFFQLIFVSSRMAHLLASAELNGVLAPNGIVAAETAKFIVPLTAKEREQFMTKLEGFCSAQPWEKLAVPPVCRRRRDENDHADDVHFYRKKSSSDVGN